MISSQWLIIVCLLAVIPALIAVLVAIMIKYSLQGAMSLIHHDIAGMKHDIEGLQRQKIHDGEFSTKIAGEIEERKVFEFATRQMIDTVAESVSVINNKLSSRERIDRKREKEAQQEIEQQAENSPAVEQLGIPFPNWPAPPQPTNVKPFQPTVRKRKFGEAP